MMNQGSYRFCAQCEVTHAGPCKQKFDLAKFTAQLKIVMVVAEAIRELGEVPSGHLYAGLMSKLSIDSYNNIIDTLKNGGLVSESGHVLKWTGPVLAA